MKVLAVAVALLACKLAHAEDKERRVTVRVTKTRVVVSGTGFERNHDVRVTFMRDEPKEHDDCTVDTGTVTDRHGELRLVIDVPAACCDGRGKPFVVWATPATDSDFIPGYESAAFGCRR